MKCNDDDSLSKPLRSNSFNSGEKIAGLAQLSSLENYGCQSAPNALESAGSPNGQDCNYLAGCNSLDNPTSTEISVNLVNNKSGSTQKSNFTSSFWFRLILGQLLSFIMSTTGVSSTLLVNKNSSLPVLQSVTAYVMIAVTAGVIYIFVVLKNKQQIDDVYTNKNGETTVTIEDSYEELNHYRCGRIGRFFFQLNAKLTRYSCGYPGVMNFRKNILYFLPIALIDLEANFVVVKAYQYTDITSIQLLDCSSIFFVMILSYLFLKNVTYYLRWHIVGAGISIFGMIILVILDADGLNRTSSTSTSSALFGDMLTVLSGFLYAASNVACELIVRKNTSNFSSASGGHTKQTDIVCEKSEDRFSVNNMTLDQDSNAEIESKTCLPPLYIIVIIEYIFWMSTFGALLGTAQFFAVGEYKLLPGFAHRTCSTDMRNVTHCAYDSNTVAFADVANGVGYAEIWYDLSFGASMVFVYNLMPVIFYVASATFANLSLLTSDFFSIIWNVTLFKIYPKSYFFAPLVVIITGLVVFDTNGFKEVRKRYFKKRSRNSRN